MLGYEVKEEASVSAVKVTYNTLWFNLDDVLGITNIKLIEATSQLNPNYVYLNNSSTIFETKKVGGFSLKNQSRRYDIELRKSYEYYYDQVNEELVRVEMGIPMLFIQAENLSSFTADVQSENSNLNLYLLTSSATINKIQNDYATLIDIFIENKDNVTSDSIIDYIG